MQILTNIDLKKVTDETKRVFLIAYDRCLYFKISSDLYAIVTNKITFPVERNIRRIRIYKKFYI